MTVLEAVKQGKTPAFMYTDAIKTAQAALTPPETVLWAHTGNVILDELLGGAEKGLQPGVTVITSHRILFCKCIMGNSLTRSIALPDIGDIQRKPEGFTMSLHVHSLAGYLAIQGNSGTIPKLASALEHAIEAVNAYNPAEFAPFYAPATTSSPAIADTPATPPVHQESTPTTQPDVSADDVDLEPYFQTYYPSRSRAAQALHRDTGLDMAQCKTMVSTYFSANLARVPMPKQETFPELKHILSPKKAALEKRMKELDSQGIAYCPKCASTSITAGKRGFSVGKAVAASFFLSTESSLIAGAAGANKPECICMKCGHTWRP